MRFSTSSNSILRRFKRDARGNVAIIFGLTLLPMMIAAGAAVDIARAYVVENKLQAALDAAALSAATVTGTSEEERITAAKATFQSNYPASKLGENIAQPTFELEDGVVVASVAGSMDTTLMQVAGIKKMDINVSTEITVPGLKDGEIVLVLDYSGSMRSERQVPDHARRRHRSGRDLVGGRRERSGQDRAGSVFAARLRDAAEQLCRGRVLGRHLDRLHA